MDTISPHAHEGKTTFIYILIDPDTQQVRYVGKANNPQRRFYRHTTDIEDTHKGRWIHTLKEQGKKPILHILEEIPLEQWQERECYWIAYYREREMPLTNSVAGGYGPLIISEETREKMSRSHKGRIVSEETRALLSAQKLASNPMKGRKASEETRSKMSIAHKGKGHPLSEEAREKLRQANLGKKYSEESKAKRSAASKRLNTSQYMIAANRGRKLSEETKEKIRQASLTHRHTPETCAKLSVLQKGKKGKPLTEEAKHKISLANTGKIRTLEQRARISAAKKKAVCREESAGTIPAMGRGRDGQ